MDTALAEQSDERKKLFRPLRTEEEALQDRLGALFGDSPVSSSVGPIELSVQANQLVPTMAAVYLAAFEEGAQAFPYFEASEGDS